MKKKNELLFRGLPKWPQHYVTGESVTIEQAKEIIRRTDRFFVGYNGNNHRYNKSVRLLLHMAPGWDEAPYGNESVEVRRKWYDECSRKEGKWSKTWRVLETNYVHNSWISCCFIGGPHGWCHPDGSIGFIDNVGKWPSVEKVLNDWKKIAKEFPFLVIGATLYDGESCEENKKAVVSFAIKDGRVRLVDPEKIDVHKGHPEAIRNSNRTTDDTDEFNVNFNDPKREQGIDNGWIYEWGELADRMFGPRNRE